MPTMSGKSAKTSRLTDSQPSSGNAISSSEAICRAAMAPAPPMATRYTARLRRMASTTAALRLPFPMVALRPRSYSAGANASIRPLVVGPKEPQTAPARAGVGPA